MATSNALLISLGLPVALTSFYHGPAIDICCYGKNHEEKENVLHGLTSYGINIYMCKHQSQYQNLLLDIWLKGLERNLIKPLRELWVFVTLKYPSIHPCMHPSICLSDVLTGKGSQRDLSLTLSKLSKKMGIFDIYLTKTFHRINTHCAQFGHLPFLIAQRPPPHPGNVNKAQSE